MTPPPPVVNTDSIREAEVLGEIAVEGLYKYGLPSMILCIGATFLMRRRVAGFTATRAERFILSAMHYYAASDIGFNLGMKIYEPTFEQKVVERIPNSDYAKIIRESRRFG
ncbi:unnamed protein product [Candidula unifasciata]|uniref:Uncharacterized protein n=1 Tax=Candidula unifasciata TaxID=100452 RepID=A0A8S4A4M2_9EUPU|nr:unnamed protein product [Candidula unifasciata]